MRASSEQVPSRPVARETSRIRLPPNPLGLSLVVSSGLGNSELVRLLLKCGANADTTYHNDTSALMTACTQGHAGVADLLLKHGASVDVTGPEGATALIFASQEGRVTAVELLLLHGANANTTRDNGSNALMAACFRGHTHVVDLLLKTSVAVNTTRRDGVTALMLACNKGHVEVAELLLKRGATVDIAHGGGTTALMSACRGGHSTIVKLLLSHGAQINLVKPDGETALMFACEQGHAGIAELLLKRGASVDMTRTDGSTALYIAHHKGHTDVVYQLLKHGASTNVAALNGQTALMVASQQGHAQAAEFLMKHGASVDIMGSQGATALMVACQSSHVDVAKLLLQYHANVNLTGPDRVTALMMASEQGCTSAAELLLGHGARVNTTGPEGVTALILASQNGHLDVTELLLAHGAEVNATKADGVTALMKSCEEGHADVVELLLNSGAGVDMISDSSSALAMSCQNGLTDVVERLLKYGASVNLTRDDSSPALMLACIGGHTLVVELLLKHGASVNVTRSDGVTALMWACQKGHIDVVKVLLEHGASVEATGLQGLTALMMACEQRQIDVAELLLTHGASVDASKNNGSTALITACLNNQIAAVELLLRNGASANTANASGVTPLMAACERGVIGVIDLLLSYGADVDMVNEGGFTALMWASADDHTDVAEVLLNHGANIHLPNEEGTTALMQACSAGHTAVAELLLEYGAAERANDRYAALMAAASAGRALVIELLIKYGASLNMARSDGFSVLMAASACNHAIVTELLINCGASVDLTNKYGRTALMLACQLGHADVVRVLLRQGASANTADNNGDTPLMVACRVGHSQITDVLLNNSASVHAVNARNQTALLVAAAAGHFDIMKRLIGAGASIHVCSASGETLFTAATRLNHLQMTTILYDAGYSVRRNDSSLPISLFPSTLQTLHKYALRAHEFEAMWSCVVKRLASVYSHFEQGESLPRSAFSQFVMILARFIRLHAKCRTASIFTRLVMCRSVVSGFEDLHAEIDYLLRSPEFRDFDTEGSDWRTTWESKVAHLLVTFQSSLADDQVVSQNVGSELDQVEAITLLRHELRVRSDLCSPELLALLQSASSSAERRSSISIPEPPRWFLSSHEIDLDRVEAAETSENPAVSLRGKWLNSVVTVRQLDVPAEAFTAEVDRWSSLSHPNVIKVFGASHLRAPFLAVFENVLSANLREYLSFDANRPLVWAKLHEAALGVKYLHDRGVVLGNLQCSNIWVGTNGLAKIAGLEAGTSVGQPACVRWTAPECQRGEPASCASDIYSLGVCIIEAVSGTIPWSDEKDDRIASLVEHGSRPEFPDATDKSQERFVRGMWLRDPSRRPNIASVVAHLKAFAGQNTQELHRALRPSLCSANASSDLDGFVFPELGSSIQGFLQRLKSKCDLNHGVTASVLYIHERLVAVYDVLIKTRKWPREIEVVKFCEVLVRFDSQVKIKAIKFCEVPVQFGDQVKITISEKSTLLYAKSLKIALASDVFHKQIDDDVLALLPAVNRADPVHDWRRIAERHRLDELEAANSEPSEKSSGVAGAVVKLVEQESERVNRNFQQIDLDNPEAPNQARIIPLDELKYAKKQEIGEGAFGKVYKATWLDTPVVVKFTGYEDDGGESRRLFSHELRIWSPLNHSNVIKLYGAGHIGKRYFVCEHAGNGSLLDYLKRASNETKLWQKLHEVSLGLAYLHEQNIVHNDLKCDNFLVGSDDCAKIIDFGLSCIPNVAEINIDAKAHGAVGWRSPEYLRGEKSTLASDVYAFGMCILEAVTKSLPWGGLGDASIRFQVLRKEAFPPRPEALKDDNAWRLVEMMCVREPSQRLGMPSVVERLQELAQLEAQSKAVRVKSSAPELP